MTVYKLSTARLPQWKAWLTLNGIPTKHVVRDSTIDITDREFARIHEFRVDSDGHRIHHTCECDGPGHLAKRQNSYRVTEMPGAWADADLVSA